MAISVVNLPFPRAGHATIYCRDRLTMFSSHKVALYYICCGYSIETSRPKYFLIFSGPWCSITLSWSYTIVACPVLPFPSLNIVQFRRASIQSWAVSAIPSRFDFPLFACVRCLLFTAPPPPPPYFGNSWSSGTYVSCLYLEIVP